MERVMTFASARTLMSFNRLGAGRTVRESDMGNLDHLKDLLGRQLAAPLHQKLGRTACTDRSELSDQVTWKESKKMGKRGKLYSPEFKEEAVRLVHSSEEK